LNHLAAAQFKLDTVIGIVSRAATTGTWAQTTTTDLPQIMQNLNNTAAHIQHLRSRLEDELRGANGGQLFEEVDGACDGAAEGVSVVA